MKYTALYRKFRPDTFAEVKGQDAIVKTLQNQIISQRVGHAYLFCGTRGTGKTTLAKIMGRAVNCEHPINGNPCNVCETCRSISEGSSMNVIEIDAASNNGVDSIRQLKEETEYMPASGKYKVYIIDEVHMLSIGAFNALLKTLEEPPSYVIFILATTEMHKIPVTILSRCQRYEFKRISTDTIRERLTDLSEREDVKAEEKALRYIAKKADGSMRDALSILDQCISFYIGGDILTYDKVLEITGAVDTEVFHDMLQMILANNIKGLSGQIEELAMQGRELNQFVTDFTWYLRNLLMLTASGETDSVMDVSSEGIEQMKILAGSVSKSSLFRYLRVFSELANRMKYEASKRVALEVALIRMCTPEMETDIGSLIERIRKLEQRLDKYEGNAPAMVKEVCVKPVHKEDEWQYDVQDEDNPFGDQETYNAPAVIDEQPQNTYMSFVEAWLSTVNLIPSEAVRETLLAGNYRETQMQAYVTLGCNGNIIMEDQDLMNMIRKSIRDKAGKDVLINSTYVPGLVLKTVSLG